MADEAKYYPNVDLPVSNYAEQWENYVHDHLGLWHGYRILVSFSRLMDEQIIRILNDNHWFDTLNQQLAPIFDFDQSITILHLPINCLNILSVAFLGIRFLIDIKRILQSTFFPNHPEPISQTAWLRFCDNMGEYGFSLLNDALWVTLNALSNLSRLPASIVNPLMMGGLCFDISLLLYKKSLLDSSKDELAYIENCETLNASILAGLTVLLGFSLLLTASAPIVGPMGSFLCILSTAIYLSADKYGIYQSKSHHLNQLKKIGANQGEIEKATKTQTEAWTAGWSTLTKNLFLPAIWMGVIAICWPAAILMLTATVGYETLTTPDKKAVATASI